MEELEILINHQIPEVRIAVWISAAILTYKRKELEGQNDVSDYFFQQQEIIKLGNHLCLNNVQNARVSQWYNADHLHNTYNYLRAEGKRRRLTLEGEFDGYREFPDFYNPQLLQMEAFTIMQNQVTMSVQQLFQWYRGFSKNNLPLINHNL